MDTLDNSRGIGSYGNILTVSMPLVLSMASNTVMEFTDRIFLARYSIDAIAAAMPAGITAFLFTSFFIGVAGYINVFIAQYTGAGQHERVGVSLWQGIYFSLAAGVGLAALYAAAESLFRMGGHPAEIQKLEVTYFKILIGGAGASLLATSFSCFYNGRGLTRPVMLANIIGMTINIPLDYVLINGIEGLSAMGIKGAAIATVTSRLIIAALLGVLIFTRENDRIFGVWRNRRFEKALFLRLMKFGLPGGVRFFMEIFAFTFFIFMVGRIGKVELAASNIVVSINSLAFMPMMGFSLGTSTLVGQALGAGLPEKAVHVMQRTLRIAWLYTVPLALIFVIRPEWLLEMFRPGDLSLQNFSIVIEVGSVLLRFVAFYLIFDASYMVFVGVLEGAGDTRFIMWSLGSLSLSVMVLPVYWAIEFWNKGLYFVWGCATFYIMSLCTVCLFRCRRGRWQRMRVIESHA